MTCAERLEKEEQPTSFAGRTPVQKKIGLIEKREVDDGLSKQPLLTHGEIQIWKLV